MNGSWPDNNECECAWECESPWGVSEPEDGSGIIERFPDFNLLVAWVLEDGSENVSVQIEIMSLA